MVGYGMVSYLNFTTTLERRKHYSDFPLCREGLERRNDLLQVAQLKRGLASNPEPKPTRTPYPAPPTQTHPPLSNLGTLSGCSLNCWHTALLIVSLFRLQGRTVGKETEVFSRKALSTLDHNWDEEGCTPRVTTGESKGPGLQRLKCEEPSRQGEPGGEPPSHLLAVHGCKDARAAPSGWRIAAAWRRRDPSDQKRDPQRKLACSLCFLRTGAV